MKEKLPIQKHLVPLARFAILCGFVIPVTCAGRAGVAQENNEHQHRNKIYKIDVSGSASKPLLDMLSRENSIVDFDKLTPPFKLYPALIGPGALGQSRRHRIPRPGVSGRPDRRHCVRNRGRSKPL
jgi:hypothetical protein